MKAIASEVWANYTAPKNSQPATTEDLKASGVQYGFTFSKGDVITFPTQEQFKPTKTMLEGVKNPILHCNCVINGKTQRNIPFGSFQRKPHDWQDHLKSYPLNMEINNMEDNYERFQLFQGKSIKVVDQIKMSYPAFDANHKRIYNDGIPVFVEKNTPIFEWDND